MTRRGDGLRTAFPIYVGAPAYSLLSGGIRAMNLLCHHLDRLGYDAFVLGRPWRSRAPFELRSLGPLTRLRHRCTGREPIVIYPEITRGNPYGARFVVRYLLNKPGFLAPGAETTYGPDDYFIDGAREHAPPGARSFDLFMPLVDRALYFPPPDGALREGFAVFTNRAVPDVAAFPRWLTPRTALSIRRPCSHAELAQLYRRSRAMVVFERTSAIFEALCCGCPVICIGNQSFDEATYHPRFRGAGLVWGWREEALASAAAETAVFRARYRALEADLDARICAAFDWIIADVARRLGAAA